MVLLELVSCGELFPLLVDIEAVASRYHNFSDYYPGGQIFLFILEFVLLVS